MKLTAKHTILFGFPALLVVGLVAYYGINLFSYKLTVTNGESAIKLHTLQLGEYVTPVRELRILDSAGADVVTLTANAEESAMHTVTVSEGINSFEDEYLDGYRISYADGNPYEFLKAHRYKAVAQWRGKERGISF